MSNPWEEISLSDYESHMKLNSVRQLQAMNALMKSQLDTYPVSSVMILGVAGGNGLEHIAGKRFVKVYGRGPAAVFDPGQRAGVPMC